MFSATLKIKVAIVIFGTVNNGYCGNFCIRRTQ